MNQATRIFLVALRLAIGWHFLVEGVTKVESVWRGPTETHRPWTSAGYLREASGPMAPFFRDMAGDLDKQALERLTPRPLQPGDDPERTPPVNRFPAALSDEWEAHFERFAGHYSLNQQQRQKARAVLVSQKDQTALWLLKGEKVVRKSFPSGVVEAKQTTPQRVADYEKKLAEIDEILQKELPAFGEDVRKAGLRNARADVARMRSELMNDLNEQTAKMHAALLALLDENQKQLDSPKETLSAWQFWTWPRMELIDWGTRWLLVVVGACLLLGLFTRLACLAGACFLFMIYTAMPPLPGMPEALRSEGSYLFVNKNLIEMIALLVLSTTSSGRWLGLDGLLYVLLGRSRGRHHDRSENSAQ
jgi:uncharacterized membrane protein YphA (DoxX/SURF4 family)